MAPQRLLVDVRRLEQSWDETQALHALCVDVWPSWEKAKAVAQRIEVPHGRIPKHPTMDDTWRGLLDVIAAMGKLRPLVEAGLDSPIEAYHDRFRALLTMPAPEPRPAPVPPKPRFGAARVLDPLGLGVLAGLAALALTHEWWVSGAALVVLIVGLSILAPWRSGRRPRWWATALLAGLVGALGGAAPWLVDADADEALIAYREAVRQVAAGGTAADKVERLWPAWDRYPTRPQARTLLLQVLLAQMIPRPDGELGHYRSPVLDGVTHARVKRLARMRGCAGAAWQGCTAAAVSETQAWLASLLYYRRQREQPPERDATDRAIEALLGASVGGRECAEAPNERRLLLQLMRLHARSPSDTGRRAEDFKCLESLVDAHPTSKSPVAALAWEELFITRAYRFIAQKDFAGFDKQLQHLEQHARFMFDDGFEATRLHTSQLLYQIARLCHPDFGRAWLVNADNATLLVTLTTALRHEREPDRGSAKGLPLAAMCAEFWDELGEETSDADECPMTDGGCDKTLSNPHCWDCRFDAAVAESTANLEDGG